MSNDADRHNAEVRLRTAALDFGLARDDEYSAASVELLAAAQAYAAADAPTPRAPLDADELQRVKAELRRVQTVAIKDLHREELERTPSGTELCYLSKDEVIVLGWPEHDDPNHNCDEMGCGTFSHVARRIPLAAPAETAAARDPVWPEIGACLPVAAAAPRSLVLLRQAIDHRHDHEWWESNEGRWIAEAKAEVAAAAPRDEALDVAARELAEAYDEYEGINEDCNRKLVERNGSLGASTAERFQGQHERSRKRRTEALAAYRQARTARGSK